LDRIGRLAWSAHSPPAMADGDAPRVLVIDDDPGVREVVCSLLVSFGYDCQTAVDGQQGLIRFDEGGWDLVLTDLVMPTLSGWDVIEGVRRRVPTMPIVLITALNDPAVMRRAHDWRVRVVAKPFRTEALKAALVEALYAQFA
jgi:CheY-like chemotaxis protein